MDHSLFIHSLGDGVFGIFPSQGHNKAAMNILTHAFCRLMLVSSAESQGRFEPEQAKLVSTD